MNTRQWQVFKDTKDAENKVRLSYERCVWFRFHLDEALLEFMYNILIGLDPEYSKIREIDHKKIVKSFENFVKIPVERVIDTVKHFKIRELVKIETDLSYFVRDLQRINKYPHDDVTPKERVLFDSIREDAIGWQQSWDKSNYYAEEAKWGKIESINWMDLSYLEFAKAVKDEEHLLRRLHRVMRPFISFLEDVLKLKTTLDDLKQKYGEFESSKTHKKAET